MADEPLDFTPFDAEANLVAVNDILKSVRHLSWSYAGDISRVVKKICTSFDAGRCILFAVREGSRFDVYEHVEAVEPLSDYFNSDAGQAWLNALVEQGEDLMSSDVFMELGKLGRFDGFEAPESLASGVHIMPLKNPYTSRYGIKPGFMLIQEPRGLKRWNKRQLESLVIVAEYLAMTIECERLTSAMQIEASLADRIPGLLTRRKFSDLVEWELLRAEQLGTWPCLVLVGFPERTKLSLPQIVRDAEFIFELSCRALVRELEVAELAAYWRGDIMVAFSASGGEDFVARSTGAVQRAFKEWTEKAGVGVSLEGIPAVGCAYYGKDGSTLDELHQAALADARLH